MVFAHIIGEPIFDIMHHGIIFGLGFCAGIIGVAYFVTKRVK